MQATRAMTTNAPVFSSRLVCWVVAVLMSGIAIPRYMRADEPPAAPEKPAHREPIYDEKADAKAQIADACKRAQRENKRVLVMFGGNWCGWCYKLHDVFLKNDEINPILRDEFELVMVDFRSNRELLESYGKENSKHGVPFLTVLDPEGNVLTNQNTSDLENGSEHDVQKVKDFLSKWIATPLDAEQVLQAGLERAKAEEKLALVHIGAPSCGWCRVLDRFLEEKQAVLSKDFVDIKIDIQRMSNGVPVAERLRKKKEGGIPWFAILDVQGTEIINSDGPQGNIGYPARAHEITHFMGMLQKTAHRTTSDELSQIQRHLEEYAKQHNLE